MQISVSADVIEQKTATLNQKNSQIDFIWVTFHMTPHTHANKFHQRVALIDLAIHRREYNKNISQTDDLNAVLLVHAFNIHT